MCRVYGSTCETGVGEVLDTWEPKWCISWVCEELELILYTFKIKTCPCVDFLLPVILKGLTDNEYETMVCDFACVCRVQPYDTQMRVPLACQRIQGRSWIVIGSRPYFCICISFTWFSNVLPCRNTDIVLVVDYKPTEKQACWNLTGLLVFVMTLTQPTALPSINMAYSQTQAIKSSFC